MAEAKTTIPAAQGATLAVVVLTAMNLLNYLDRWVPSAVKDQFKRDLHLTDAQTSFPLSAFIIVYMLTSPIFGALADKFRRTWLIAAGVAIWSLATGGAALATGFWSFLVARALVGIGEAAYATISPALLSDFYAPARRNTVLTIFYIAVPVGSALGYVLGGHLGERFGWRAAFLICGLPGLAMAVLALFIPDPGRGRFDHDAEEKPPRWMPALKALLTNRPYIIAVGGYTAVTFASGALADWFPTFLIRHRGMSPARADYLVGFSAIVGGLGGTITGGFLADRLKRWTRQPYLALCGLSMIPGTIFAFLALNVSSASAAVVWLFAAQFFIWFYNGPVNAVLANSVPGRLRVRAFALSIFIIHSLGDALSPSAVGIASDVISLPVALQIAPIAMTVATIIWLYGWRMLPEEPAPPLAA